MADEATKSTTILFSAFCNMAFVAGNELNIFALDRWTQVSSIASENAPTASSRGIKFAAVVRESIISHSKFKALKN